MILLKQVLKNQKIKKKYKKKSTTDSNLINSLDFVPDLNKITKKTKKNNKKSKTNRELIESLGFKYDSNSDSNNNSNSDSDSDSDKNIYTHRRRVYRQDPRMRHLKNIDGLDYDSEFSVYSDEEEFYTRKELEEMDRENLYQENKQLLKIISQQIDDIKKNYKSYTGPCNGSIPLPIAELMIEEIAEIKGLAVLSDDSQYNFLLSMGFPS